MLAQDLMTHPIVKCHVNEPLNVAAHLMWEHDCGAIAVVDDEGRLTGVITDRDICMAAYTQGLPLAQMLVHTAMARSPISVGPDQPLQYVLELMGKHRVRRIPVIDAERRPLGMISMNDIARTTSDSRRRQDPWRIAQTLAAICTPRAAN